MNAKGRVCPKRTCFTRPVAECQIRAVQSLDPGTDQWLQQHVVKFEAKVQQPC